MSSASVNVAQLEADCARLGNENSRLVTNCALLQMERDQLKQQVSQLQRERDDAIIKSTQMHTIMENVSAGLVAGLTKMNERERLSRESRRDAQAAALENENGTPQFLRESSEEISADASRMSDEIAAAAVARTRRPPLALPTSGSATDAPHKEDDRLPAVSLMPSERPVFKSYDEEEALRATIAHAASLSDDAAEDQTPRPYVR